MPVNLKSASDAEFKNEYAADYGTALQKAAHVHRKMYTLSGTTEAIGAITYPVLNLSTLRTAGYTKLVVFLLKAFTEAGVRPDTPFHNNDEDKYIKDLIDSYRYMEFNCIGGGMRLVYDATMNNLFLSAHYSDPVIIRANGGSVDGGDLDTLLAALKLTHKLVKLHSDSSMYTFLNTGSAAVQTTRRDTAALQARRSPAFIGWLQNKNSRQDAGTIQDWYNIKI